MNEPSSTSQPLPTAAAFEWLRAALMSAGALLIGVAIFEALRRMRGD